MEINNSDFDKFEIANGETVIALRKEAKINKQSSIEGEFIDEGYGSQKYNKKLKRKKMTSHVSLRTYQKIEKSEQVNIKYIKYVAMLFSKKLARHVDVKDLIKGAISSNPNIINTYLNKVNSVDELLEIIKLSSTIYKKTFFNCKITEGVAKQINNIIDIIRTNINSPKDNIEIDDEKDFLIDREILKTASQVNDSLNVSGSVSALTLDVDRIFNGDSSAVKIDDGVEIVGVANVTGNIIHTTGINQLSVETVSGDSAGTDAISVATDVTFLDMSSGGMTLSIADGVDGQIKYIICNQIGTVAGGGNATPALLGNTNGNWTTQIRWDAVGEAATLIFDSQTGKWNIVGSQGVTIT